MEKVTYTFSDGTTSTVEVTDELYSIYKEMEKADELSDRKQSRRTQSFEHSVDNGWDVEDPNADVEADYAKKEMRKKLYAAIKTLSPAQRNMIKKLFWEGKTQKAVAEEEGVSAFAIHDRLQRILKKLRQFFD